MKKIRIYLIVFVCFVMAMFILKPEQYIQSVYNGLLIFCASVLPVLFPFFFFTKLLSGLNFANDVAKLSKKPIGKLFKTPPISAYIFIMSILSGYPVGAKLLSDFYNENALTADECKKISTFTSTSGPLFIIGTVGTFALNNKKLGYIILFAHILSALFNGLLYRNMATLNNDNTYINPPLCNYDNILAECITESIINIFVVGGYIALFNMVVDLTINLKIIAFLAKPLEYIALLINENFAYAIKPFLISLIEVTRGTLEFSKTPLSPPLLTAFIAGAVSIGGLSILMQSLTFLSNCKVSALFYIKSKVTQSLFAFFFAYLLTLIII